MKKIILIIISILIIVLGGLYFKLSKSYKEISDKFYTNIDDYNRTVEEYNRQYDLAFRNINTLSLLEVTEIGQVKLVSDELKGENEELKLNNVNLIDKRDGLLEQKKVLMQHYNKLVEEERKKHTYMISNVKTINQYAIGYPTGCESVALTILLNYYGVDVSVKNVVDLLRKGDLPHSENGIR